jgi:hypothetical protein
MIDLTANSNEGADLHRPDVCLNSMTPLARNACQAVASAHGFQSAEDVASSSRAALENPFGSLRANVHQNVHQRIKKDGVGYVRIKPNSCCKCLKISALHSDSDPRLQLQLPEHICVEQNGGRCSPHFQFWYRWGLPPAAHDCSSPQLMASGTSMASSCPLLLEKPPSRRVLSPSIERPAPQIVASVSIASITMFVDVQTQGRPV